MLNKNNKTNFHAKHGLSLVIYKVLIELIKKKVVIEIDCSH